MLTLLWQMEGYKKKYFIYFLAFSWTNNHLSTLWNNQYQLKTIVYPPCNVEILSKIQNCSEEILKKKKRIQILSVGQIRPEKNHLLQLEIFSDLEKIIKKKNVDYEV